MLEVIAAIGALWWLLGIALYLLLVGYVPIMIWSGVRSLKGIRRELAALNDTIARLDRLAAGATIARTGGDDLTAPGPRYRVSTGPLDIR